MLPTGGGAKEGGGVQGHRRPCISILKKEVSVKGKEMVVTFGEGKSWGREPLGSLCTKEGNTPDGD